MAIMPVLAQPKNVAVFPPGLGMESFELREDLQHYLVWTAADRREGHVP